MKRTRKPLLIFVPGLAADGSVYRLLLDRLRRDYTVRSADPPIALPAKLGWDYFTKPITKAAGSAKSFYLVGHSLGGAVALHYAARHPGRVTRLVVSSPPLFPAKRSRPRWWHRLRNLAISLLSAHPGHALAITKIVRRRTADGQARALYRFAEAIDLSADLPKLANTTILWPRHEEVIRREFLERVRRDYPSIGIREVPGAHHRIALAPGRTTTAILEELNGQPA